MCFYFLMSFLYSLTHHGDTDDILSSYREADDND